MCWPRGAACSYPCQLHEWRTQPPHQDPRSPYRLQPCPYLIVDGTLESLWLVGGAAQAKNQRGHAKASLPCATSKRTHTPISERVQTRSSRFFATYAILQSGMAALSTFVTSTTDTGGAIELAVITSTVTQYNVTTTINPINLTTASAASTTSLSSSSSSGVSSKPSGFGTGMVVGVAIGGVCGLLLLVAFVVWWLVYDEAL